MKGPDRSGTHPEELLTAAYLDGTLDGEGVERIERHLARCPDCRKGVVALRALPPSGDGVPAAFLERADARSRARRARAAWGAAAGIAALLVTAVAVGSLALRHGSTPSSDAPLYRATEPAGLEALAPVAGARVEGAQVVFRWSPSSDAKRYVLTVLSTQGEAKATLAARPGATTVTWLPDGDSSRPITLVWKVQALRDERVVGESRPYSFELH